MAHFAEIDENSVVVRVLVVDDIHEDRGQEFLSVDLGLGGTWVQTSYNTHGNQHPEGRPLHKNYAGIGYHWDGVGFYAPQPYPSWIKNEETYLWEAPVAYPTDGKPYVWNEANQKWDEVSFE